tara:strand:+ start:466 stop:906 length:441 start_codon:yes stop_codon:yes gene_type:complete
MKSLHYSFFNTTIEGFIENIENNSQSSGSSPSTTAGTVTSNTPASTSSTASTTASTSNTASTAASSTINNNRTTINRINQNTVSINTGLEELRTHPGASIQYNDLQENKKFKQMENDYKSMILQDKFLLALGGITLASLIILRTQL